MGAATARAGGTGSGVLPFCLHHPWEAAGRNAACTRSLPHTRLRLPGMLAGPGQHRDARPSSVLPPCGCEPPPLPQPLPGSLHPRQQLEKQSAQGVSPGISNNPRVTWTAPPQGTSTGAGCFALGGRHHRRCSPRPSAPAPTQDSPAHPEKAAGSLLAPATALAVAPGWGLGTHRLEGGNAVAG